MACLAVGPQSLPAPTKWGCETQLLSTEHNPACDTTLLLSYGWSDALQTDQYGYCELSTDSGVSEDVCLECGEALLEPSPLPVEPQSPNAPPAKSHVTALKHLHTTSSPDVALTIQNEMRREAETRPCSTYLQRLGLSKGARQQAVSWSVQVIDSLAQQQETLFLAISYLDRFLSVTQDVVHIDGLQLATLACLSLASKQTEVCQPSSAEWTWLLQGNTWGTKEQLSRMEWIVMDNLDWRGCTPTAWWFLHLFCYGLGTCPAQSICMAAYLLELGLLESGCLALSYSSLAAAALLLGHACVEQRLFLLGTPLVSSLTIHPLLALAPELNLHEVHDACKLLAGLHQAACSQSAPCVEQALQGQQLVRAKYSTDVWHNVGTWPAPVDCAAALERL